MKRQEDTYSTMPQDHAARILIIDDEPIVRQTVERALSPVYEIQTLSSSEKLEHTFQSFRPDLIILDVRMPQEDGWHLCSRMRRDKRFDIIPVVFLSALSDEASVRKGFSCGGDFYLPKPFDIHELLLTVEIFIGRKHRYPEDYS
jgi:DNA-binding response OmpR family regulator